MTSLARRTRESTTPIRPVSTLIFAPAIRLLFREYEFGRIRQNEERPVFLSTAELRELTGYQKPALQRRWLAEHGYKFDVRADGRAVVLAAAIEQKLAGHHTSGGQPDWSALE
jgi:hypothetical protein